MDAIIERLSIVWVRCLIPSEITWTMPRQSGPSLGELSLGEAARALGVSVDTLRRWDRAGKLRTRRGADNRRRVPLEEVQRLRAAPQRHRTGGHLSARNRMPGQVRSIEVDGVMALVEVEAGPFLLTAAVTRDAVEELGLLPGDDVIATVKATSMMISRD